MAAVLFPIFKRNRAYTPQAFARAHDLPFTMPNMNMLPVNLRKAEDFAPYAAKQVAKCFRLLQKYNLYRARNPIALTTAFLFPQLARCRLKKFDLQSVWGKYTKAIIRLIANQPAGKLLFCLEPLDDAGDDVLLRQLAKHPALKHHTFLLHRPSLLSDYSARSRSKKKGKRNDTAILFCPYDEYSRAHQTKKAARLLRQAAEAGSFFILD